MIHVEHLTKTYGDTRAVDDLSFEVRPGIVTGFLGPNGAGKSTTMRMILGLDRPSSGRATVDGKVLAVEPNDTLLSPLPGFAVFAIWTVGLLAAAVVVLRRRDA